MKVLHLPSSVGGNAWGLAQGERFLGLDSSVLVSRQNWLQYPADINLNLQNYSSQPRKLAKLAQTFLEIRNKYDIFHFNFGSSLIHLPAKHLNQFELPFYPDKAKLFVTYNGCDARQKYLTIQRTKIAACHNTNCYGGQCNSGKLDKYRRQGINKMERYVSHIWALNPDLLYFLPKGKSSFLPYSISFDGIDLFPPKLGKKLKIVHAPTNREAKGSDHILAALQKIQKTQANYIDVSLVENLPHAQALKIYQEADLIIDQVLIGWYGGFAVEAMKMGKPIIARIAQQDLHFLPEQMAKDVVETVIQAEPDTIYQVLLNCIENRQILRKKSEASLEYVNKWHNLKYVANLTKQRYESI
ncbi:MAG: glycosyltransferase [Symploca sp. SIO2E6]|nr:glycosyltransferase [Symploca sp. SIO2E6]